MSRSIFPNIPIKEFSKKWYRLWRPIINKLLSVEASNDLSALIKVLSKSQGIHTWKSIKTITEYALQFVENAPEIFSRISSKINKKGGVKNDEVVNAVLSELQAAVILNLLGVTNLVYCRKNSLDYNGELTGETISIEVKYVEGPPFKTQEQVNQSTYRLSSEKLKRLLQRAYREKETQITKYKAKSYQVLLIVTHLSEVDYFSFDHEKEYGQHPLQNFVDKTEIPTIIFGPSCTIYISKKIADKLLPFDPINYQERAYGIMDMKEKQAQSKILEEKIRKKFFETVKIL